MGPTPWNLLVVGLGVAALSAAGLAFAIRSTRSRAMTAGPAVAGLTCSVVLLIGLGMTLYGLNLSGNLGR